MSRETAARIYALAFSAATLGAHTANAQSHSAGPTRQQLLEQALQARSVGDFARALTLVERAGETLWTPSARRFATEMLLALSRREQAIAMAEACLREAATSDARDREVHLRACYELREQARLMAVHPDEPTANAVLARVPDASSNSVSIRSSTPIATSGESRAVVIEPPRVSETPLQLVANVNVNRQPARPFCCTGAIVTVSLGVAGLGVSAGLWATRNDLLRNCSVDATSVQCDSVADTLRAQGAGTYHWAAIGVATTGIALVGAGATWALVSAVLHGRRERSSLRVSPIVSPNSVGIAGTF